MWHHSECVPDVLELLDGQVHGQVELDVGQFVQSLDTTIKT